jgi:hypothetical protein
MRNRAWLCMMVMTLSVAAIGLPTAASADMLALSRQMADFKAIALDAGSTRQQVFAAAAAAGLIPPVAAPAGGENTVPLPALASTTAPSALILPFDLGVGSALPPDKTKLLSVLADAQGPKSRGVLLAQGGHFTLADIEKALDGLGASNLYHRTGATLRLDIPFVVSSAASLSLSPGESLLLGRSTGAFLIVAGDMNVDHGDISGSDEINIYQPGFRPFVLAGLSGQVRIQSAHFEHLGTSRDRITGGLVLSANAGSLAEASFVADSTFLDVGSLGSLGMNSLAVRRNVFRGARGVAIDIETSRAMTIADNLFSGTSTSHAIRIGFGSTHTTLAGNIVVQAAEHGIYVASGAQETRIVGNFVGASSQSGIAVVGAACTAISGNTILANGDNGITARRTQGLAIADNTIAGNAGSGLSISGQTAGIIGVRGNSFSENRDGLHSDGGTRFVLARNTWVGQSPRLLGGQINGLTVQLLSTMADGAPEFVIQPSSPATSIAPQADCRAVGSA